MVISNTLWIVWGAFALLNLIIYLIYYMSIGRREYAGLTKSEKTSIWLTGFAITVGSFLIDAAAICVGIAASNNQYDNQNNTNDNEG